MAHAVLMSPVSNLMITTPFRLPLGTARKCRKPSDDPEVKESIINAYEIKTGLSARQISNLMNARPG